MVAPTRPLFPLGLTVATPPALDLLARRGQTAGELLARHAAGDWGDVGEEDRRSNGDAVTSGLRLLSVYDLGGGDRVWVITEADRSSTCVLTPDCY